MKIINPSVEIIKPYSTVEANRIILEIEKIARVCYKSENNINETSYGKLITHLIDRGHEAMLEHSQITIKIICDRGISHELVRHRIASYAQESTRYCNYSKDKFGNELTFIKPCFWNEDSNNWYLWKETCRELEKIYLRMLDKGATPQEARSVLPNSLKTEIVMTTNIREWRHFLKLRTAKEAHPQMREIANMILKELKELFIIVFDDIN
jgi:thymidylate synthase (FAD)